MWRYLVTATMIAVLASACSTADAESLTIYSGRSEDLVQPIIDRFVDETGIDVTVRYADSADLAATILEEGDGSPADVFFAQDPASLGTVALAGLFAVLPDEVLASVPERFSDTSGAWVGVSGRARVVVHDPTVVPATELPETEDGFVDPSWADRVAIAPTNGSFLAFVAAKILLDGEEATRSWLTAMADNGSPTYPRNSAIVTAVIDGQVPTGLVNHYYLLRALTEDPGIAASNHFFTTASAGSIVMPAGVGVMASSESSDAALTFVRYLLGTPAQRYFSEETFEYPLVPGVEADPRLPAIESLPTPDLDLSLLATTLDQATDLVAEAGLL